MEGRQTFGQGNSKTVTCKQQTVRRWGKAGEQGALERDRQGLWPQEKLRPGKDREQGSWRPRGFALEESGDRTGRETASSPLGWVLNAGVQEELGGEGVGSGRKGRHERRELEARRGLGGASPDRS